MLSILVYGRNDSHGYNLHKRAAISLNVFGNLIGEDDEIVFVDYNTPDDLPTFPEAIRDTLTGEARRKLRILRVRPSVHLEQKDPNALLVVEPIARNIGLRRSNPANRWVLNTNTDIIVGMRGRGTFQALVKRLDPGFYQAPRVEIPESVWESFDRSRPTDILAHLRSLAPALHLHDIVYGNSEVMFDGPGDFQLAERDALFAVDGFDERMVRGWHVDANLSVRMAVHYGAITSLQERLFTYHCDHTRQVTPLHKADHVPNDPAEFVHDVRRADLPTQRSSWGAPDKHIEEIKLDDQYERRYFDALRGTIGTPQTKPLESAYRSDSFDRTDCDFAHVLPFLADLFSSVSKGLRVGWAGHVRDRLDRFAAVLDAIGLEQPIFVLEGSKAIRGAPPVPRQEWLDICDAFVFDFSDAVAGEPLDQKRRSFLIGALDALRSLESDRSMLNLPPRRIVGVNVVHNRHERAFNCAVAAAAAPFSTRVRVGYARPKGESIDWLAICARDGDRLEGSATGLRPGRQNLQVGVGLGGDTSWHLRISIEAGAGFGVDWQGPVGALAQQPLVIPFNVATTGETIRLRVEAANGNIDTITTLWSAPEGSSAPGLDSPEMMIGNDRNWLPHLHLGPTAQRVSGAVEVLPGQRSHAVYGPYWPLPEGRYVATFKLEINETQWSSALLSRRPLLHIDVLTSGGERLARRFVLPVARRRTVRVPFTIREEELGQPVELRLFTGGSTRLAISHVGVARVGHGTSGPEVKAISSCSSRNLRQQ